ncbi:MAG: transcriptional regulator NrdR, partial [Patescibacteria group bacterium]|nr:transcriptional regulator NrdR [Patescibacteria group bacterium]
VIERLKELDEVAYMRFTSVYKSFKDAKSFAKELDKLKINNN